MYDLLRRSFSLFTLRDDLGMYCFDSMLLAVKQMAQHWSTSDVQGELSLALLVPDQS